MKKITFILLLVVFKYSFSSECSLNESWGFDSALGRITESRCGNGDHDSDRYELNGAPIYQAGYPFMSEWRKKNSSGVVQYYIFSTGDKDKKTKCNDRMVLLDLTANKVRAFNFGVHGSCHEFKRASYKNGKLEIVLKNNLEFSYKDGNFLVPKRGPELLMDFFPSQWYDPKSEDELIPYAEEFKFKL